MPKSTQFDQDLVLQNAMQVFWDKGYHATSMQDLVDATGLNRSSIYNSFGDKFNLFYLSIKRYQTTQKSIVNKWLVKSDGPKGAVRLLFEGILSDIIAKPQNNGCFISNCTTEMAKESPEVKKLLQENQQNMEQLFYDLIVDAQELGQIDTKENAHELAAYYFSSLQGLRVVGILNSDETYLRGIIDRILQ
ncbi:MAG: TetR/AcrR family transcriptional regulator [Cyclobacteriaceae bacterium]